MPEEPEDKPLGSIWTGTDQVGPASTEMAGPLDADTRTMATATAIATASVLLVCRKAFKTRTRTMPINHSFRSRPGAADEPRPMASSVVSQHPSKGCSHNFTHPGYAG